MPTFIQQSHSKELFLYTLASILNKFSFYGVRTILILYMVSSYINFNNQKAIEIFGVYVMLHSISKILSGFIGDLILKNNKKAFLLGGLLMVIGCFSIAFLSEIGLFIGLGLTSLGSALISNNLLANFGKLYFSKNQLLDSGFATIFAGNNIGSFFSALTVGYIGETYGWQYGFILTGVVCLINMIVLSFIKLQSNTHENVKEDYKISWKAVLMISLTFWLSFYLVDNLLSELSYAFHKLNDVGFIGYFSYDFGNSISFILMLIVPVFWSYYYNSPKSKILLTLILGALSLTVLSFIPSIPTNNFLFIYILSMILYGIADVYISPILHTALTKQINHKHRAIAYGLIVVPTYALQNGVSSILQFTELNNTLVLWTSIFILVSASIGIFLYFRKTQKTTIQ